MPPKPRVKPPHKRGGADSESSDRRRWLLILAGGLAVVVLAAAAFLLLGGGGSASADAAEAALQEAGCELTVEPAVANVSDHSDFPDPDATSSAWNTDPPTSGPHYGQTLIYGAYSEPVQIGRVVHNLEHGAVYILYGNEVPPSTVAELRTFYDDHQNGTILAPYAKLGNRIALGAWLAEALPEAPSARGNGVLATCSRFDERAFAAFFHAFQFKGPESSIFAPSAMEPGDQ